MRSNVEKPADLGTDRVRPETTEAQPIHNPRNRASRPFGVGFDLESILSGGVESRHARITKDDSVRGEGGRQPERP